MASKYIRIAWKHLAICHALNDEAELIMDSVEGWIQTKYPPSIECDWSAVSLSMAASLVQMPPSYGTQTLSPTSH